MQLLASADELLRLVTNASRGAHGKIRDAATLQRLLAEYDVRATIAGRESLTIDLEATTAADAAELIVEQLD